MASVVDTTVKWWDSNQAGLPTLSGTAGSLLGVLDLLVNGHSAKGITSLVVSGGVATVSFSGTHPALVGQVIEMSGSSITALNGEQKVTAIGSGFVRFATAASNGTATGSMSFKLAGAGWQWQFSNTNLGVLTSVSPEKHGQVLRIDDTGAQAARVVAYESMSDVNTGTNPFPTSVQQSGGGYWWKSGAANANAVKWFLAADARFLILWCAPGSSSNAAIVKGVVKGFGDPIPIDPAGDIHSTILCYSNATSAGNETSVAGSLSCNQSAAQAVVSARDKAGAVTSLLTSARAYLGNSSTVSLSGNTPHFGTLPTAYDGKPRPSPRFVAATATTATLPRATIPGLQSVMQSEVYPSMVTGDTLDGANDLDGRVLYVVSIACSGVTNGAMATSDTGAALIDITGPWR